ncbi:MAG: 50S ribosomal protein L9 [Gammaproteobacteria bacterium]|nr:50S ribosomal protein L9 [Gammaproteobacteria bacterium]
MNVILLGSVGNLGHLGDEVVVKAGFARNFLIPQGKAVRLSSVFETKRAELEQVADEKLGEAQKRAGGLEGLALTILVKAGEEGKLYGSVGTQDITDAIGGQGLEVARNEVRLPEGIIRAVGEYQINVQLHSDVVVAIELSVVAE